MNYILFDSAVREALLPLTFTRPVADIRIGILTIREKWERYLRLTTTTLTEEYLEEKFPMLELEHNVFIDASFIPTTEFFEKVRNLKENQAISYNEELIAFYSSDVQEDLDFDNYELISLENPIEQIENKWDIFTKNELAIQLDFELLTADEISADIPDFVTTVNKENIFVEEGVVWNPCIINASSGPIYIGKNAVVLDGALVRGPFALCENSVLKMGAKIYGPTTIGPNSKIGGEVKNSVVFGNSNKGHEGYLGNSVIGEWCNFGADTNVSNLKNTYSSVLLWNYETGTYEKTNQQFCGLIMGDHSKTGINTMFNTGTVVGVSSNIFGAGFPEKFIPSFSWGASKVMDTFKIKKAVKVAKKVLELNGQELSDIDISILNHIYGETSIYINNEL
ncbi:putative sugar nucleotidyl transferase [Flavobacteriaceae bacterium]|nr:putative sugar nucleotidyl transferase [Flavobacteriaceae bacterium]